MSVKLQKFSFLIYAQGIVEETFNILSNLIILKSTDILNCNFYFEGYTENDARKKNNENKIIEIQTCLKNNYVNVNALRIDLYKKK